MYFNIGLLTYFILPLIGPPAPFCCINSAQRIWIHIYHLCYRSLITIMSIRETRPIILCCRTPNKQIFLCFLLSALHSFPMKYIAKPAPSHRRTNGEPSDRPTRATLLVVPLLKCVRVVDLSEGLSVLCVNHGEKEVGKHMNELKTNVYVY